MKKHKSLLVLALALGFSANKAQATHFSDGGTFDQIYQGTQLK